MHIFTHFINGNNILHVYIVGGKDEETLHVEMGVGLVKTSGEKKGPKKTENEEQ